MFGIDLPDERKAILLELYVQTVLFCREHMFKSEQTSALLSIIRSIHEANIGKQSQTAPQFETKQAFHINDKNKLWLLLFPCRNSSQQHRTVFWILQRAATLSLSQGLDNNFFFLCTTSISSTSAGKHRLSPFPPQRPPFSISLFSSEEVSSIFKYINRNYIRHYKLYKYFFTPLVRVDNELFCKIHSSKVW